MVIVRSSVNQSTVGEITRLKGLTEYRLKRLREGTHITELRYSSRDLKSVVNEQLHFLEVEAVFTEES